MTLFEKQKEFFLSGKTHSLSLRKAALTRLYKAVSLYEDRLSDALYQDLGKSAFESYETEIGLILSEIRYTLHHLKRWAQPKSVPTSIVNFPGKSTIYPQPKGVVLIISPWNYPVLLLLSPLIAAIAAGNCACLKPSELAPHTSAVLGEMIRSFFSPKYISVCQGDERVSARLLTLPFDHIFFTGSPRVGKIVMEAAAKTLTPVTLELGGKSPCIVEETADLSLSAKRILWGKIVNAGQTCVAPDYLLVQDTVKDKLLTEMKKVLFAMYGNNPAEHPDYPKIINERHFHRLCRLITGTILCGGQIDQKNLKIAPTLLDHITLDDPSMKEEIFGPLLPVLTFSRLEEAIEIIRRFESPLALYLFTQSKEVKLRILKEISFGGGCINDTIMHLANENLPFGGVGASGMGAYHGKCGFDQFTHYKSVLEKGLFYDNHLRYPPYKYKLLPLKWILK
ncbi:aldehyde dehydrogenase [Youxingia wuxianensis]|uniref:Aldehyde dehydrogenase n=1 Tax=Youxingia wuxianensis TaxID=2763678 RepID=A0A926ELL8_9FIRM|nr:aldehyde dehydrogenase [Youxingia wuxianensis]MBC8584138.1 aldehyde dehydrogenase [Youxingia wuxianensis]